MNKKPRVHIIFTGGTISMKIEPVVDAAVPVLRGAEILAMVPGIERVANVTLEDFAKAPGPHVTPAVMWTLSRRVQKVLAEEDVAGVVITHGTDTLEETAYLLDLTLNSEKPVVLLGAMRTSSELSWDGPHNLLSGVRVASLPSARNRGVLVAMGDEIHAASEVTKTHTEHVNTFQSPDFGPLGVVEKNEVIMFRGPYRRQYVPVSRIDPQVELVKMVSGADDRFFRWAVDSGAHGIVVEGTGRGNVPPDVVAGIDYSLSRSVPVVLVSRCLRGRVLDSYAYSGGGRILRQMGVIFSPYLNGQKARIKLIVGLGKTRKMAELQPLFE